MEGVGPTEYKHETDHDTSKVNGGDPIHDEEDICIGEILKAVIKSDGECEDEKLKIEIEGWPRCRLMFGNGCNDGDVVFSVWGIEQGIEATSPWSDFWSTKVKNHSL